MRCAEPVASLGAASVGGGSIGSYALRAFDATRDLKSSRKRRTPALNGVSPTHNTYPWNYPRYVYEFNLQKRERDGWAGVGMGKGGGRERGGWRGRKDGEGDGRRDLEVTRPPRAAVAGSSR